MKLLHEMYRQLCANTDQVKITTIAEFSKNHIFLTKLHTIIQTIMLN